MAADTALRYADESAAVAASYKVDVAKHPDAKTASGVSTLPAVTIFKDGKPVKTFEGVNQSHGEEIQKILTS